jgi:hypothetical protein
MQKVSRVSFSYSLAQKKWNSMDKVHRMLSGGYSRFISKLSREIHQDIIYMDINDHTSVNTKTIATMELGGLERGSKPSESTSRANTQMQNSVNSQFNLSRMRKNRESNDLWIKRSPLERFSEKFRLLKKTRSTKNDINHFSKDFMDFFELKKITGLSIKHEALDVKPEKKLQISLFPYCEKAMKEFNTIFQNFYHGFKIERQDLEIVFVDFAIPFDRGDIDLDLDEDW